jgi:hypothetical protein
VSERVGCLVAEIGCLVAEIGGCEEDDGSRGAAPASAAAAAAPPRAGGGGAGPASASAAAAAGPGAREPAVGRHLQPPVLQLQRPPARLFLGHQGAPLRRLRQRAQGPIRAPRARARLLLPRRLLGLHRLHGPHCLQVRRPCAPPRQNPL